jgi:hypothetical protein
MQPGLELNAWVEELVALNFQLLLYIVRQIKQGPGAQALSSIEFQCLFQNPAVHAMKSLLEYDQLSRTDIGLMLISSSAKNEEIRRLKEDYHLPCNERLACYEALLCQARCDYDALADAAKKDGMLIFAILSFVLIVGKRYKRIRPLKVYVFG